MNADERLERAAHKFADNVAKIIAMQVERSIALERDRLDSDIAGLTTELDRLRSDIETQRSAIAGLRLYVSEQLNAQAERHSVRVTP